MGTPRNEARYIHTMEGILHYINPAHAISLLSALNEERLKGQLCDVVLIVGDQKFRAHKNVLAASSEYFHSLFTNKQNESQSVFQLDFCEADAFDNVLNYIYSSSLFVEKSSLAAVQELGYSLGISFLTNILSKTPQAPFGSCPSKRTSFQDEDESSSQQRSVIVCQSRNEAQGKNTNHTQSDIRPSSKPFSIASKTNPSQSHTTKSTEPLHSMLQNERWLKDSPASYTKLLEPSRPQSDQSQVGWVKKYPVLLPKPAVVKETADDKLCVSVELLMEKGMPSKRPQQHFVPSLRGSSDSPYLLRQAGKGNCTSQSEDRNLLYYSKLGLVVPSIGSETEKQSIDRSGPLVKSLLRRSLSVDSQVPVYSSNDLKSLGGKSAASDGSLEEKISSLSQKLATTDSVDRATTGDKAQVMHSHRFRSFSASQSTDREVDSPVNEVRIKTEPNSPLSDPSEIISFTVGDASPSTSRDFPYNTEESQRNLIRLPAKRRYQADKKLPSKQLKETVPDDNMGKISSPCLDADFAGSDDGKDEYNELEVMRPNKKFKCKHCLKIFRSTAGLHRHINMYHNPEKPYACDICHKRFHTNFKVWTHCQTQHGIVKNPSPASSSQAVLDEKFQRKLIDIVREREIKKALIVKLRRGKQGFQAQSTSQSQAIKRNLRPRTKGAYICTYCGKAYRFLSQFKQHIKMHPGEKPIGSKAIKPKEFVIKSPVESKVVYHCRLCNTKLSSVSEQENHERLCRNATVCPYCSLRFTSSDMKHEHENKCEYKKLTCLECMRTFKSSFSIWRHQVEVHNQNTMAPSENFSLPILDHNGEMSSAPRQQSLPDSSKINNIVTSKEDSVFSDSSEQMNFDSEDSACLPEDLSVTKQFNIQIKEEPAEDDEDISDASVKPKDVVSHNETGFWPCEKCGKIFTVHKQLERHQELLCSVKPFICHVCKKAFRTNFRLWSHFQSHMTQTGEQLPCKEGEHCPVSNSPSPPPPPPPPPPLPKIQPIEPDGPTNIPEGPNTTEKLFAPQESDTLFYHAPPLSAITFKRQYMCKLCHRTFKTAFSLWSHERTHL